MKFSVLHFNWQSTVSSRLTLKERRIHTRFPVFILGVYLLIDFESRCIGRVLLVRGSRIKNEVYIHVSQCLSSVFSFTACCLLRRKCKRTRSGHHQYNKMQLSGGNSTCKVVKKIIRSLNRTNRPNRPNRQTCKGSLSIMRCNFRMENPICQIEHNISHSSNRTKGNSSCRVVNKIVHSPNRTNRLNRQT